MVDEQTSNDIRGIKNVEHVKRFVGEYPSVAHYTRGAWSYTRRNYGSNVAVPFCSGLTLGPNPILQAYNACSQVGAVQALGTQVAIPGEPTNERLGELPSKIYRRLSDLELSISGWEARELPALTKQMLQRDRVNTRMIQTFRRLMRDFNVTNMRSFQSAAVRAAMGLTLMTQFGLNPTVQDAKSILQECQSAKPFRKSATVAIMENTSVLPVVTSYSSYAYGKQAMKTTRELTRVWGANCLVVKDYGKYGRYADLAQIIDRYGGRNPLASLWAVMPYSFVVDWLAEIDNMIDAEFFNNNPDYQVSYWKSTKRLYRTVVSSEYISEVTPKSTTVYGYPVTESNFCLKTAEVQHEQTYSSYKRERVGPPGLFDGSKILGRMGARQTFLSLLLALGVRR